MLLGKGFWSQFRDIKNGPESPLKKHSQVVSKAGKSQEPNYLESFFLIHIDKGHTTKCKSSSHSHPYSLFPKISPSTLSYISFQNCYKYIYSQKTKPTENKQDHFLILYSAPCFFKCNQMSGVCCKQQKLICLVNQHKRIL